MIDPDLLQQLEPNVRLEVKRAIGLLANCGILLAQKERLLARLAQGSDEEDVEKTAKRVLDYRKQSGWLVGLHQMGESYVKELTNEHER